jgi:hypothetical protein
MPGDAAVNAHPSAAEKSVSQTRAAGSPPDGSILSAYERRQVEAIARWKSTEPSRLTQAVELLTQPIAWGVRWVVPAEVVRRAIRLLNTMAEAKMGGFAGSAEGGHETIAARRQLPLEACDRLAADVIRHAERISAGRGLLVRQLRSAVVGRLPFQLVAALATISKIGHCYGYPLDRPLDRAVVLDLLELALVEDCGRRAVVLARLHTALDRPEDAGLDVEAITAQAGRDVLADELADELVQRVPIIGGVIGFIGDRTFMQITGEAATRFFQERRLRDEGKVTSVAPATEHVRRSSFGEIGRAVGETVYAGGAIVGFAATLPVAFVGRGLARLGGPVAAGAAAGAHDAASDAHRLMHAEPAVAPPRLATVAP